MKKTIIILLTLVMMLSLAACGGGSQTSSTPAPVATAELTTEPTPTETPATPKEDFYGEWENYETGDTLRIDSKDIVFEYPNGSSYQSSWIFAEIVGDTLKDNEPIGELRLTVVEGYKQLVGVSASYITKEEADKRRDIESLTVGETAETELAKITIKKVVYSDKVDKDIAPRLFINERGTLSAPKDKTFVLVYFDFTNLSKEQMYVNEETILAIDYNGYQFKSSDGDSWLFEDAKNGSIYGYYGRLVGGYLVELSPLMSNSYFACVPVPKAITEDASSELRIIMEIGNEYDKDYSVVRYKVSIDSNNQKADTTNVLSANGVRDLLTSHEWKRTIDSDNSATMVFSIDGTGTLDFTDGTHYDFKWKADSKIVDVTLIIDGREAPGSYDFVEEEGNYSIVMTDNSSFTYIAQ